MSITSKPTTFLTDEYSRLIAEVDKLLSILRDKWLAVSHTDSVTEKADHMRRINTALDERLRLMKAKEAAGKVTSMANAQG